jgi:hypothetical protein
MISHEVCLAKGTSLVDMHYYKYFLKFGLQEISYVGHGAKFLGTCKCDMYVEIYGQ